MDMDRITQGLISYRRRNARKENGTLSRCPVCQERLPQPGLETFTSHVRENAGKHPDLISDEDIAKTFKDSAVESKSNIRSSPERQGDQTRQPRKRPVEGDRDLSDAAATGSARPTTGSEPADPTSHGNKKLCSPPASVSVAQNRGSSPSETPDRSRARQSENMDVFDRGQTSRKGPNRGLYDPKAPSSPRPNHGSRHHSMKQGRPSSSAGASQSLQHDVQGADDPSIRSMILQPETRPIAQEQLVAEVKGIYAGLVMVESKCVEVDSTQAANTDNRQQLSNEQWQALIALHRTLLHEHHDFFLASQHPAANQALRRLAAKYAMPARMWRHGIHSFLELLRHKLPESLEHMLTFIYLAYSMVALLYETVPTFEETWIECLGDLGRYRMAIEDDDIRDREIWTGVSQRWYTMASDMSPTTGRLYHHRAILARPNVLQQLYYYTKSLCVAVPFLSARESIMTLFDPMLNPENPIPPSLALVDAAFVRIHGILFSSIRDKESTARDKDQAGNKDSFFKWSIFTPESTPKEPNPNLKELKSSEEQFLGQLDGHVSRNTKRWLESGYYMGNAIACSLLGYGHDSNVLMRAISRPDEVDVPMSDNPVQGEDPGEIFQKALDLAARTYTIVLRRWGDMNTLPFLHVTLVFMYHMSQYPVAMAHLEGGFPWKLTAMMLNTLLQMDTDIRMDSEEFPGLQDGQTPKPLPEDHSLNGLLYSQDYFPLDFFVDDKTDNEEKYLEVPSMMDERRLRILWLGQKLASHDKWLTWDNQDRKFSVAEKYDVQIEEASMAGADTSEPTPSEGVAHDTK